MTILLGTGISLTESRRVGIGGPSQSFTPAALFVNGEQRAWYDPSDRSTLFQDTGGTIPVTADGQRVSRVLDKSGNGHHLVQLLSDNCPYYRSVGAIPYLELASNNGFISGNLLNSPTVYNAQNSPLYIGVQASLEIGNSFPLGLVRDSTDNILIGCSTTGVKNWSSRYRWDGDQIFYYKPGVGENLFHWADMQTTQAAIVANDFIDFQVDGSAGTLTANNAPATSNISYVPAIGTQNMSTGSPDTHAFFGGIIVLRMVIQNDRDRLRTYFRTPR